MPSARWWKRSSASALRKCAAASGTVSASSPRAYSRSAGGSGRVRASPASRSPASSSARASARSACQSITRPSRVSQVVPAAKLLEFGLRRAEFVDGGQRLDLFQPQAGLVGVVGRQRLVQVLQGGPPRPPLEGQVGGLDVRLRQ